MFRAKHTVDVNFMIAHQRRRCVLSGANNCFNHSVTATTRRKIPPQANGKPLIQHILFTLEIDFSLYPVQPGYEGPFKHISPK